MSVAVDGNNRVVGHTYYAAGFTTAVSGTFTSLTWGGAGRLLSAAVWGGGTDSYQYDPSNARVWRNNRFFLRGTGGEVLAVYDFNPVTKTFAFVRRYAWFAGKMVGKKEDRLGTVQSGSRFYPYGEEWSATTQDDTKFATYWRDGSTNLDYAMNRYYQSTLGRFLSPDPFRGSASKARSGSWNRYAYVEGDPANANDPSGLCRVFGNELVCDASDDFMEVSFWPKLFGRPGSPGSPGGSHGGGPEPPPLMWEPLLSGLHYYMTTPEQRANEIRRRLREGNIAHECEALAQFAEMTWEDMAADSSRTADQWVAGFGVLTPTTGAVRRANDAGIPIASMPNVSGLNNGERPSGFAPAYRDGEAKDPETTDQSHHFAAFFQMGYHSPVLANLAAIALDIRAMNTGDILLGMHAGSLGQHVRNWATSRDGNRGLPPGGLGNMIRMTVCEHN